MINTSSLLTIGAFRVCFYHHKTHDADFHSVLCDVVRQYMFDKRLNHSFSVIITDSEQLKQPGTVDSILHTWPCLDPVYGMYLEHDISWERREDCLSSTFIGGQVSLGFRNICISGDRRGKLFALYFQNQIQIRRCSCQNQQVLQGWNICFWSKFVFWRSSASCLSFKAENIASPL